MEINRELLLTWLSLLPRNKMIKRVLAEFPNRLKLLWEMNSDELNSLKNINLKFYQGVVNGEIRENAIMAYNQLISKKIEVIGIDNIKYPEMLKETEDAPAVLFYKGDIEKCRKCISVIGSRKATAYGLKAAQDVARDLASKGACIVSGMARGIDSRAHIGALAAGGITCAVIGCGIDVVYPAENKNLMEEIMEKGVVISEFAPGTAPLAQNFPARNRIISGLSFAVVVVEAGKESGTLITVDFALEQGRDVFAVPGNIYSDKSEGTNNLIREGARIVTAFSDIINEYEFLNKGDEIYDNGNFTIKDKTVKYIIEAIKSGCFDIDETINDFGCSVKDINALLMKMQIDGIIDRNIDGEYYIKL